MKTTNLLLLGALALGLTVTAFAQGTTAFTSPSWNEASPPRRPGVSIWLAMQLAGGMVY
jgi:hypothetical protein